MRNCSAIFLPTSNSWVSGLLGRLLVPDRFQTFSPWSRPLADSGPHPIPSAMLAVIVIIRSIAFQLVSALTKVVGLAEPSFSVTCSQALLASPISRPRSVGRLVSIGRCFQYCFIGPIGSSICERSKTKSILLIDRALASNYPPWVHVREWTAEPSRVTSRLSPMASYQAYCW